MREEKWRRGSWGLGLVNVLVWLTLSCTAAENPAGMSEVRVDTEKLMAVVESVDPETVRLVSHKSIDLYATFLKWKVDMAIDLWERLTPEDRRRLVEGLVEVLKYGQREFQELLPALSASAQGAQSQDE